MKNFGQIPFLFYTPSPTPTSNPFHFPLKHSGKWSGENISLRNQTPLLHVTRHYVTCAPLLFLIYGGNFPYPFVWSRSPKMFDWLYVPSLYLFNQKGIKSLPLNVNAQYRRVGAKPSGKGQKWDWVFICLIFPQWRAKWILKIFANESLFG